MQSYSLYLQGWSALTLNAGKFTSKASESATQWGSLATQKMSALSETVSQKVRTGTLIIVSNENGSFLRT